MGEKHIFVATETDIHFNLATEKYLIEDYNPQAEILFLWKNKPVVVIGRYQNPWEECSLGLMEKDGVALARRCSGGGAVYQDLGNICFTLIAPRTSASSFSCAGAEQKAKNFQLVLKALQLMGLKASLSGRNDILIDGRKVSGSAFQTTKGRLCHHGTMLVKTDLSKLSAYLTPNEHKLESHGVKSVASRVANLTEFKVQATTDRFAACMVKAFRQDSELASEQAFGGQCSIEVINKEKLDLYPKLRQSYETFSSKEWNFGKSPKFTNKLTGKFSCGIVTFYLTVEKGVITQASVASDTLHADGVEELEKVLLGLPYDPEEIKTAQNSLEPKNNEFVCGALALLASLLEKL